MIQRIDSTRIAVFYGAGISFPVPTCIPLASGLLDSLWASLEQKISDGYAALDFPRPPAKWPQFEVVMDELDSVRPGLLKEVLTIFSGVDPNTNHRLLASLGEVGCALVTTNFDTNVETALADIGQRPNPISAVRDCYKTFPRDKVSVLKLHGCISRPQTIVCSTRHLARRGEQNSPLLLSIKRFKTLEALLDGRTCFVLGYSGSDRLDILPALRQLTSTTIVWGRHGGARGSLSDDVLQKLINYTPGPRREWYDKRLAIGDTTSFLGRIAKMCGLRVKRQEPLPIQQPNMQVVRDAIDDLSSYEALLVALRILQAAGSVKDVVHLLRGALEHSHKPHARLELLINLARFSSEGNNEIEELKRVQRQIRAPISADLRARIALFTANALDSEREYDRAYREVGQAIRLARASNKKSLELDALLLQCLLLSRLGRSQRALKKYLQILPLLKRRGSIRSMAEACNNIGCLHAEREKYDEAWRWFYYAQKYWEIAGAETELLELSLNIANILFHAGEFKTARKGLNKLVRESNHFPKIHAHALLLRGHDACERLESWQDGLADLAECLALLLSTPYDRHLLPEAVTIAAECKRAATRKPSANQDSIAKKKGNELASLIRKAKSVLAKE